MNQKSKKILFIAILAVLLTVFCVSAFFVVRYVSDALTQKHRYDELVSIVEGAQTAPTDPSESTPDAEEEDSGILREYRELYQMNADLAGWLKIEGTDISYPVMHTPQDPNYYLYRNFDGDYNAHGCLFTQAGCDLSTPSDNVTIYGHHMKDGSMFAELDGYMDKTFWEEHRYVQFDTLTEHHTYEIFAVFKTTATVGEGFEYHQFIEAGSAEDFDWFIGQCKSLALYDTDITPVYGDKIICLSTCEYTQANGRLVVAAMRID